MKRLLLFIIIIIMTATVVVAGAKSTVSGRVFDAGDGSPLEFVNIVALPSGISTVSGENGRWSLALPEGRSRLVCSFVGYRTDTVSVSVPASGPVDVAMTQAVVNLREVVVTARESQGIASSSRIDRDAMSHLQPTSFTDLLELLPGQMSQTPDMGKANTITLREVGGMSATGARSDLSDDYAITSLGTSFVIDGAPVNNDAGLQSVPSASSTDPAARRSVTNRGVDMRTISTDNIESVEVVRGIPSAEYGNLTSGVVNIRRVQRATPLTARFKADEYSKLFSAGKGIGVGPGVVNADIAYLDSRSDPRDSRENYKRLTGSVRTSLTFGSDTAAMRHTLTAAADYTGSFDNVKVDPDLNYNKTDDYISSYNRMSLTAGYILRPNRVAWLESLTANAGASYEVDRLKRRKLVAPQRASIAPTTMEPGVHDGHYLLTEYLAEYESDGRPFTLYLKLKAQGSGLTGAVNHRWKGGAEWSLAKNYGHGQVYDLSRPLSASWTTRPRDFRTIPALNVVSAYAEDNLEVTFGQTAASLQAGVRTISLAGLDRRYDMAGKVYADPRVNLLFNLPPFEAAGRRVRFLVAAGYGLTTKMPTTDYLYPQIHYLDLVQLNYYDVTDPAEFSRVSLRTYIADATNYGLRPARNRKLELRLGADFGDNSVSVTVFHEHMNDGFRYTPVYAPYELRRYDASAIVPGSLTAPPDIATLPYTDLTVLDGYNRVSNGSRIDKAGIEYQISTARFKPLRTALTVNGAWLRTRYSNSGLLYEAVTDVVGSRPVAESCVGLYATNRGRVNEQFNTNFMFDTQVPRWGLIFTTSVQCLWFTRTTRLRENGVPVAWLSAADGLLHEFTDADISDPVLQHLVKTYSEQAFAPQTVPPAIYLNLKATKQIGRHLRISAFVNRLVDYLPDYKSNGLVIRRVSDAYFGMEATFTL